MQCDGEKWNIVSGWVKSDRELLLPLIYERAAAYAKEHGIVLRDASN
jgi:branched-chain amino acid transport system substrate-binding protein